MMAEEELVKTFSADNINNTKRRCNCPNTFWYVKEIFVLTYMIASITI